MSVIGCYGTEPNLYTSVELYKAITFYKPFRHRGYIVRIVGGLDRLKTVGCGFTMLGDAFRLVRHGMSDCWSHRTVTSEGITSCVNASKFGALATYTFVLGAFSPRGVVWVKDKLGLPRLTLGFKISQVARNILSLIGSCTVYGVKYAVIQILLQHSAVSATAKLAILTVTKISAMAYVHWMIAPTARQVIRDWKEMNL